METRLLRSNEIEVKVKQVKSTGCLLLLYKTARVDMQILDKTYGIENWACDYKIIDGVLYCGIGVFLNNQWVWKWDCGIESKGDGEGNEKKGQASDAFKRAGFKWGIGRELYNTPFIWAKVPTVQKGENWYLADKYQSFYVESIQYNALGEIIALVIKDSSHKEIFSWKSEQYEVDTKLGKQKDMESLKKASRELLDKYPHLKEAIIAKYNDYLMKILPKEPANEQN